MEHGCNHLVLLVILLHSCFTELLFLYVLLEFFFFFWMSFNLNLVNQLLQGTHICKRQITLLGRVHALIRVHDTLTWLALPTCCISGIYSARFTHYGPRYAGIMAGTYMIWLWPRHKHLLKTCNSVIRIVVLVKDNILSYIHLLSFRIPSHKVN